MNCKGMHCQGCGHGGGAAGGAGAVIAPVGVDLGIAVFSALDIVLARLDLRPRWVRLVPWTLTAATVYLNVTGQHTGFARVAHAVFPALWVIAVEVAAHVVRVRAGLAAGTVMDRIRPSRWLLAPVPTARLMRRMVLWEIRSYPDALRRDRDRLLALTELQDTYGPLAWRWRARWLPWWGWPVAIVAAVVVLSRHGAPDGQRIIRTAIVPTAYQPPTPEVITRALGSLGVAAVNAVIKDGPGIGFVSDVHRDGDGWGSISTCRTA